MRVVDLRGVPREARPQERAQRLESGAVAGDLAIENLHECLRPRRPLPLPIGQRTVEVPDQVLHNGIMPFHIGSRYHPTPYPNAPSTIHATNTEPPAPSGVSRR